MSAPTWLLDGNRARLNLQAFSVLVDADRPVDGLSQLLVADQAWKMASLFSIVGATLSARPPTLVDWYVRGNDLAATYETSHVDAARLDIQWSAAESQNHAPWSARLDMLVSVRTDRLDWQPDVRLQSSVPSSEVRHIAAESPASCTLGRADPAVRCHWFQPSHCTWSLVLMIHPADVLASALEGDGSLPPTSKLIYHLFRPEMLEKGVILRARARALIVSAGVNAEAIAGCYEQFIAADPPLGI